MAIVDVAAASDRAACVLSLALRDEVRFEKAHAAEALLRNGLAEGIREVFLAEELAAPPKYRIVVWRVLAQVAVGADERAAREGAIRAAALDESGPDRAHAFETWAKLRLPERPAGLVAALERPELRPYARWALAESGGPVDEAALVAELRAEELLSRMVSAYALMFSRRRLGPATKAALRAADADAERWVLAARHAHGETITETAPRLLALLADGAVADRRLAATALARRPVADAVPALLAALDHGDADVRIYAAEAILAALRR